MAELTQEQMAKVEEFCAKQGLTGDVTLKAGGEVAKVDVS